jgi:hypothetical protein
LRERIKVRGAVKFFSSPFFPLHSAGEGKGEGSLKKLPFIFSLPLRERIKVRGAVKNKKSNKDDKPNSHIFFTLYARLCFNRAGNGI